MYISDVALQARTNQTLKTSGSVQSGSSADLKSEQQMSKTLSRPLISVPAAVLDLSEYAQSILSRMSPGASQKSTPGEMSQEAKDALKEFNDKMSKSTINADSVSDLREEAELPAFTGEAIAGKGVDEEDEASKAIQKSKDKEVDPAEAQKPKAANGRPLTDREMAIVKEMQTRDAAVRAHEQAHVAAGGGLTSAPSYEYQNGPDGKRYVVGGHVTINTSPGRTPEETLMKAERIRASALAPADPSPADRAVASQATQMASQARAQLSVEKQEEAQQALDKMKESTEAEASQQSEDTVGTAKSGFSKAETALNGPQTAEDVSQAVEDRQSGIAFSSSTTKKFLKNLGVISDYGVQKFKGIKGIEAFKPDKPRVVNASSKVLQSSAVGSYNAMNVVINASNLKE